MMVRCTHLEALKIICHLCAHCDKESRSSWSIDISFGVLIILYSNVSSAYKLTLDETCLGIHVKEKK